ncbi:uncharacterized protein Aud_008619 [Aspergillus udagawae]|uniref:Uncharacterized protein n=1 Tax=Aspergillus udagawae TaxID=91492 RepID=A0A8E0V250_9EURO|nr:uncharacterized protein Aud_008619 [Aspergillus udagawae]GIC92158.1 hypothetical protein Aud_008619 [Aspergillus udagawae]
MINLLATKLQGDFGRESYLRHIPYTDVVSLFDSIDSFTEVLLGTVDSTIRNLEGRIITRSLLDEVRQAQAKNETQWPLNSGYLDYVTDDRDPDYWRPYVGQSSNTEQRIAQHVRAIRTGDTDTLHYFVIRRGDGHRTANFVRLWTLALPENVDPVINTALNNILEMIMARCFQSLPPEELTRVFGRPRDGFTYSFRGLNLISPLLQGRSLSPWARYQSSLQLRQSTDEDIREWPEARMEHKNKVHNFQFRSFSEFTRRDCETAIQEAINTHPHLRLRLECFQRNDKDILERGMTEAMDFSWLQADLAKTHLPGDETKEISLPIGNHNSRLGLILNESFWGVSNAKNGSMPSHLAPCGLTYSNCLVWTAGFRRLVTLQLGTQIRTEAPSGIHILRCLNRELVARSHLQVILVCDEQAERVLFQGNPSTDAFKLYLRGRAFKAWLEIMEGGRQCIYLASPAPLVALWGNSWAQAAALSAVLQFAILITNTRGIRPNVFCCQLVLLQIIRQYDWERNGHPKMTTDNLDPNIRSWLQAKGFRNHEDIVRLESSAESLTAALLMLTQILPRRIHGGTEKRSMMLPSINRRRGIFDKDQLGIVRDLWTEISTRNSSPDNSLQVYNEMDLMDDETLETQQDLELESLQCAMITDDKRTNNSFSQNSLALHLNSDEPSMPRKRKGSTLKVQMALLQGTVNAKLEFRGKCAPFKSFFRTYAARLDLYFPYDGELRATFPDPNSLRRVRIRAEIKPHGQKHPQRWASHATSEDPASRLAFRLTVMGPEKQEFGFYASGRGAKLVKKANGFIDWMSGVTDEEIATKPRRYLNIQMSHEKVPDALRPFVGGAYTDGNGKVMSGEDKS